ncbi:MULTISPECIES: NAD(P)-dependent alcohol dehydrogenase [Rhodococcus]|uniref:NAD(P)-dependent alcohol dehydrogenase n=1 Tax=Rhodococcus TaxID=1827 RepID=UPI00177DEC8D|nr:MULTISPECIES: NAD(P)-dependent alcohol dehydrogenase [Rhodococcus]QOH59382.1 alcohol dehydrogenase [Rhodococcus rhodochrous]QXF84325.1 NAD(P)-dependent alcohol dehydrogenase [Rhodococcus pyridinivorans]
MKAVRVHAYGKAPSLDEVDEPRVTGPFDVLVEIGAAGLCRTDLHVIEGQWADIQNPQLPYVLGHENAGWVREVGSAVHSVAPGDAVIVHPLVTCGLCIPCRVGDDSHCEDAVFPGLNVDGGMADFLLTNARAIVKLEANLQPVQVAALADAGLTAYHAVRKAQPLLTPGTHVVVIGSGGLGHIAIQVLAATTPATITVVDRSESALELAGSIGSHHTVNAAKGAGELLHEVQDVTEGGAHVVLDFVGEHSTPEQGIAMLRNRGSYSCVGYGSELRIPTIELVSRELEVVGNLVGTYKDLVELMTLTAQGKVTLETSVYPLSAVNDAIHDLESGSLVGRGILVPGS